MEPRKDKGHALGSLGMLTALRNLKVTYKVRHTRSYWNLAGQTLAWNLPHLESLDLEHLEQGELVLLCLKLANAAFTDTQSLRVKVEQAALASLALSNCKMLQITLNAPEDQLCHLSVLNVSNCSEVDRHLIEDVGHMRHLHTLRYGNIPAACMPRNFPQSLHHISMASLDWCLDLPEGLQRLHELKTFSFTPKCESYDLTKPLDGLLPLEGLQDLTLGPYKYFPEKLRRGYLLESCRVNFLKDR